MYMKQQKLLELKIDISRFKEHKVKLLIERWRRYLKESRDFFGNTFYEFLENLKASDEDPLTVARNTKGLNQIGRGSTRVVFEFNDNPTLVLIVINTDFAPRS